MNEPLQSFREAASDSRPVPALGLIGADAIREAFSGDYAALQTLLVGTLRTLFKLAGDADPWPYVRALFDDRVVVEREGKLWSYPYSVSGTDVTLGEPAEVVVSYTAAMKEAGVQPGEGAFIEALKGGDGKPTGQYRIRAIRAGLSGNRNYYPDSTLREAVPLFNGARVFVKGDEEHLAGKGRDFRNLIGGLSEPKFVEGRSPDTGEVQATLSLLNPGGPEDSKLREACARGLTGLFGFSIDADGRVENTRMGGVAVKKATKFIEVKSVDLIVVPGAGGQVIGLVEAKRETVMDRNAIIRLLEAAGKLAGKKVDDLTDEQLTEMLAEAVKPKATESPAGTITQAQLDETIRLTEARAHARAAIAESNLPAKAKDKLRATFGSTAKFTEAEVDAAIKAEGEYIASFTESGTVRMGDFPIIEPGETRAQKTGNMLDAFFDPAHKHHRQARSFRECYVAVTGDKRVTGRLENCDQALMREALLGESAFLESLTSGSWANVLGNSITRRMIALYRLQDRYDIWRRVVNVVPVNDFRSQERTRWGGYGDLPVVAEGGNYLPLSSPTDEKATYGVTKKGGTEDVTLEMIRNDDVGQIQAIPGKMSRASKRTLSKFVFDFVRTNPTIYDAIAFFHASHNNLLSVALTAANYAAARLATLKQTELSSADRLGAEPRILLTPFDLEETAADLFRRNTNNDKTFVQSLVPDILPVWYWTDTNDWATACDPAEVPGIEIGFLDGNEEPELFVQDNPTVGSMFSNDKLTYKIRHVFGGAVVEFRGWQKSVL